MFTFMKETIKFSSPSEPGSEVEVEVPTVAQIMQWMERDLGTSINFLDALRRDTALREQMAVFLQGRISNFKNKPDPSQVAMQFGPKAVS